MLMKDAPVRKRSDVLPRVRALAMNLHWSWSPDAQRLFAAMDPLLFDASRQNPIRTLNQLSPERRSAIENDPEFAAHLDRCEKELRHYLAAKTWFARTAKSSAKRLRVAYFCAEYAVHECMQQYSGGLGVLAGDHVKSASDLGIPLVGVGLLYRCGFYSQHLRADGSTRVVYPQLDFADLPVTDTSLTIDVPTAGRAVKAKVWKHLVGRTALYLLDTDVDGNTPADRALTRHLYGGDREYRIRQEVLLGVGGVIALEALGLRPTVYHLNEGHAAFVTLERIRRLVRSGVSLDDARGRVYRSGVFTTHTPVPAGNDRFEPKLAWKYLSGLAGQLGMSRDEMLALGREDPADKAEPFCMTVLALKLSRRCNGVAALHGEVSREMWMKVYGAEDPDDVPIGHVTNGVHSETWLAPEIRPLYDKYLKPKWVGAGPAHDPWKNAGKIPPSELWAARNMLRSRLVGFVRQRLVQQAIRRNAPVEEIAAAHTALDSNALTIGFARRFATYKRAPLVFKDAKRLSRILNDPKRPVQLVFAGKAHPADLGGQAFAQEIHRHARENGFVGKVVLLEDYDMLLGRYLTGGCDVWLNNPLRPQEASGTSGMKPPLHGGINCSILDGWWPEGFDGANGADGSNGWAIGDGRLFADQSKQDAHDARCIYELLERQIVPEFYARDARGIPSKWVRRMVASMRSVCAAFSTHRMLGDYLQRYYLPAHG